DLDSLVAKRVEAVLGDDCHGVTLLDAEIAAIQPSVGPWRVGAFGEGLAGEATVGLVVKVGVEVRAGVRARAGKAVVLAGAGLACRAQHAVETDIAVAVTAIEEDGAARVARAQPIAMDVVGVLDLAAGGVDLRDKLPDAVVLLFAR